MSTGFAFKRNFHLCSVSNLRIFLVFQLRTFKVGFSGPKTLRNGPLVIRTNLTTELKQIGRCSLKKSCGSLQANLRCGHWLQASDELSWFCKEE